MLQLIRPPWEPPGALADLLVRTLDDFPPIPEIVEDADTFAGNARKKASETARALNLWVVADDSGLAVDALDGAPGVLSARYAGAHGDDDANNRKLLDALKSTPDDLRGAAFVCALALSDPSCTIQAEALATCRGRITHHERGSGGFGYDPLFLIREYHRTFAELGPLVKHQLSHRARAFARLRPTLERLVSSGRLSG
jgi:XTP/dITP diphosphohydrolase